MKILKGPQPSWHDAGERCWAPSGRTAALQGQGHSGSGCEWLRIECGGGSQVYIAHDVGRPPVIEELAPSVWIKSDRRGCSSRHG